VLERVVRTVVLSFVLAAVGGQPSFAQDRWYQLYTEGLNAFQKQQWDLAEKNFKAALAANPKQGRRVLFYGTLRDDYLPEYYLAQIYLRTGRDAQAAPLLDRLGKDGLMKQGDREFTEFSRLSAQAARAVAPPTQTANAPPSSVQSPIGQQRPPVNQTANADLNGGASDPKAPTGTAAPNPAGGNAPANPAAVPPSSLEPATVNAPNANNARVAENAPAPASIGSKAPTPAPAYRPTPRVVPAPITPVTPPAATIAELERRALGAFYRGEYPAAMSLLESSDYQRLATSDLARRKRLFYLACSGAAAALTQSGPADRLDQAKVQFATAQGNGPQFAEDRRYISPKILSALASAGR